MTWLPRPADAAVGAALLLAAACASAQLPTAEQRAFDAVDNARWVLLYHAESAHIVALAALDRAGRVLSTAAGRLTDDDYPGANCRHPSTGSRVET